MYLISLSEKWEEPQTESSVTKKKKNTKENMASIASWKLRAKRGNEQSGRKPSATHTTSAEIDGPYTLKVDDKNRLTNDLLVSTTLS